MLIDCFGDELCFSYPKDRRKSQMIFSKKIQSVDIAETLRSIDVVKLCVEKLREEYQAFDFGLEDSYCSADAIPINYERFSKSFPVEWVKFFNTIFPHRPKSENLHLKSYIIFQIVFNIIHNGHKKTPLMIRVDLRSSNRFLIDWVCA